MVYKLSELKDMAPVEFAAMSSKALRENYQNIKNIVKYRLQTFAKHGVEPPGSIKQLRSSRGRKDEDLIDDIKEALAWIRGRRSTYTGYKSVEEDFREKMQAAMPDMDLSDAGKMKSFGEFMGEMQERYGEMWHAISNAARDIYREATRLNTDPRAMMKNYDYWVDHLKYLENADPIRSRSGRKLKPSEYARKLGLEKIGGGKRRPGGQRK